eukprot:COSAG02_NODE_3151_length_7275_cov_3.804905_2_plen_56_part_00
MAFDEYGGLDPEAESFDSFAQYMDSGSKKAPDFYTGAWDLIGWKNHQARCRCANG